MILAIDAGNSRVKWGWLETANEGGVAHDGYSWTNIATVSLIEFAASSDQVNPFSVTHADPERIIISNVAGEGAHQLLVNWTSIFDAEPVWLRAEAERCGATFPPCPLTSTMRSKPFCLRLRQMSHSIAMNTSSSCR